MWAGHRCDMFRSSIRHWTNDYVTPKRLEEIETLLSLWLTMKTSTKADLLSLVRKAFVCVQMCILASLRVLKRNHHRTRLTREFHRHLMWWQQFLRVYNGVSVIISLPGVRRTPSSQPTHVWLDVVGSHSHSIFMLFSRRRFKILSLISIDWKRLLFLSRYDRPWGSVNQFLHSRKIILSY
jgi:hypothetical protein